MDKALFRSIVPYAVGLAVALALTSMPAQSIFPRPGQLGPEVWPRLAILLMGASCVFEISRRLIAGNQDATGFLEAFDREPQAEDKQPIYPRLLIGGIVLMAIYAVLVPVSASFSAHSCFLQHSCTWAAIARIGRSGAPVHW